MNDPLQTSESTGEIEQTYIFDLCLCRLRRELEEDDMDDCHSLFGGWLVGLRKRTGLGGNFRWCLVESFRLVQTLSSKEETSAVIWLLGGNICFPLYMTSPLRQDR